MTKTDDDFKCDHCGKWVSINDFIGTKNRNHCPFCLWSKHVDEAEAGDRAANCHGGMEPVGLTLKQSGKDKYGQDRPGELMLIHICTKCGKVSINRIAADDNTDRILKLLDSEDLSKDQRKKIESSSIIILDKTKIQEVKTQLFGKR
jgi:hypothetical protein